MYVKPSCLMKTEDATKYLLWNLLETWGEGLQKEYTDTNLNAFLRYVLLFAWHFLREIQYMVVKQTVRVPPWRIVRRTYLYGVTFLSPCAGVISVNYRAVPALSQCVECG